MALTRTRLDLIKYAVQAVASGGSDNTMITRCQQCAERALEMLSSERFWSFQQDTKDIVCIAPWTGGTTTGDATIAIGGTDVTIASANNLPADIVGQVIEFNSERHFYEIIARVSDTHLTLREAYSNETATSLANVPFSIMYAKYDLPANFGRLRPEGGGLLDVGSGRGELAYVQYGLEKLLQSQRTGAGLPQAFSIEAKRNDPTVWQLFLYPPPNSTKRYQLVYFRKAGWFDTAVPATSTWKEIATADADYVDWPPRFMYALEAAMCACVAKEIKPDSYTKYLQDFYLQVDKAANFDKVQGKPLRLSRAPLPMSGMRASWRSP
jgi:hypothetical protein